MCRRVVRRRRAGARRAVVTAAGVGAALTTLLAGCGTQADPSGPTGVDGLTIPTPSPDPDDFVARVDNPYLPLVPGTVHTYSVTGDGVGVHAHRTRRVTVLRAPVDVGGVATTAVRDRLGGRSEVDLFAQDVAGDVWWFGRTSTRATWRAGVDGAQAGLVMSAHPRLGDGFREALAGSAGVTAQVLSADVSVRNPDRTWPHTVLLEVTGPGGPGGGDPGPVQREWYAAGVGLVRQDTEVGAVQQEALTAVTGP